MKLKLLLLGIVGLFAGTFSHAQSTINITTAGGSFTTEKWVNITDMADGAGTQIWGQGDGTYGDAQGLVNQDIMLPAGTYWVNCYDRFDDSWDGTTIDVTAYGISLGNNGGTSPDDGNDVDATSAWDTPADELEASFMIVVPVAPSCLPPTAVAVSNVTDTDVDFTWATFASETGGYNWEIVPQGDAQGVNVVNFGTTSAGSTLLGVMGLMSNTDYDFYIQSVCAGGTSSYAGPFSFTTLESCPSPSAVTFVSATPSEISISWTNNSTATVSSIEYGVTGFTPGMGTTIAGGADSAIINSLMSNTDYDFYITQDCSVTGDGLSAVTGPFSAATLCGVFTPDYNADMSMNAPECWDEANSGNATSGPADLGAGTWTSSNHNGTPSNRINMWQAVRSDWIISPVFDLSSALPSELNVYVALTEGGTNGSGADLGSDDRVSLLMTIDAGTTWTEMQAWVQGTVPTDIGEEITYDLSTISGNVQFAFLGDEGTVDDAEDVYFHVSKFQVRETPACPDTSNLTLVSNTDVEAVINFDSGNAMSAGNYEYALTTMATTTPTVTGSWMDVAGATPNVTYTILNLTAETEYFVYVREVCSVGVEGAWILMPLNFTTSCAVQVAPYTENFDAALSIPTCWNQGASNSEDWLFADGTAFEPGHGGNAGAIVDHTSGIGNFAWVDDSGTHNTGTTLESPLVDVSGLTTPALSFWINSDREDSTNVDFSVDFWDGAAWNTAVYTSNVNTGGWILGVVDLTAYTITGPVQARFIVDENNGTDFDDDFAIDDVSFDEAPSCLDVTAVTIDSVTSDSFTVSWSENNVPPVTAWEVVAVIAGNPAPAAGVTNVTTNPFTITMLSPQTAYDVYVRADCGTVFVGPVTAMTDCAAATIFPYTTDFTTNVPNACWDEAGSGEITDGPMGLGASDWRTRNYDSFGGTNVASNAINLFSGNNDREWLISEQFDMTGTSNDVLSIEVAVTDWDSANVADTMGSDDQVDLLITTDAGVTWTSLMNWTVANQPAVNGTREFIDLSSYTGIVQFAFFASDGIVVDAEDYDFHVGMFIIDGTAGNEDATLQSLLSLYPNPVSGDVVTISLDNSSAAPVSVAIYNTLGQQVMTRSYDQVNNTINIDNISILSNGMYFVKVNNGAQQATLKFIKE